jgi:basic membrane protein A
MNKNMTRRAFATTMGAGAMAALTACGGGSTTTPAAGSSAGSAAAPAAAGDAVKITMVTDTGGVNDQSFNELSWAGMQQLGADLGWEVNYIESKQDADYTTNLDKAVDDGAALVWGVGFAMGDAVKEAAETNPDVQFAIIDNTYEDNPANLTGVAFKQEECSFAVGYIAARATKSGKVGFVGGIDSEIMQAFEQGYYAGIEYANKELGLSVTYQGQWTESFGDAALGKSTAQKMIADGCDVLYHAAGGTGVGMIEACAEAGVWAIGVDQDQAHLAPETVISSALKRVDQAIVQISQELISGETKGGTNITLGAAEDSVGIAPTHDVLDTIDPAIYTDTLALIDKIKAGDIVVPKSAEELETYKASL